ncbi:MAG: HAMP domain-containing sensor histidine kinase [Candidatus Zixiibacteriota bacterium]
MISGSKRTIAIILFIILTILLVNIAWWLFYWETEKSFEKQLSRRLSSLATLGASHFNPEMVGSLKEGSFPAYDTTLEILDQIKTADDLSEVFIIDVDYNYLATTSLDFDSVYYLSAINGIYIDSALNQFVNLIPVVTDGYQIENIVLKSVFMPLRDSSGFSSVVLGLEADVDYTDVLLDLRKNLYLSTIISVLAGLIFGFFFFIVQRKMMKAEKSLLTAQSQANLGRMVAVVSHEIKNPLMIIRASAERILKNQPENKEAGFVVEETDRLNSILTNYLEFASGKIRLNLQKINLNKLIELIGEKFIPQLAKSKINLTYWHIDNDLYAKADENALRQVIINLVLNGAEAVKDKDEAKVEMVGRKLNGKATIEVIDNGPGVSLKETSQIFEPFFTTKTTGSGLGLFHSRKLVESMNGKISCATIDDGRTGFKVELEIAE